jgi:hypothetical protein
MQKACLSSAPVSTERHKLTQAANFTNLPLHASALVHDLAASLIKPTVKYVNHTPTSVRPPDNIPTKAYRGESSAVTAYRQRCTGGSHQQGRDPHRG